MLYKDLQMGDRVRIVQNPDSFSAVIKQFEGRVGRVADGSIIASGYTFPEFRILIAFDDGRNNDLWCVSSTGNFNTIEPVKVDNGFFPEVI